MILAQHQHPATLLFLPHLADLCHLLTRQMAQESECWLPHQTKQGCRVVVLLCGARLI
jgi:hypothetical protein